MTDINTNDPSHEDRAPNEDLQFHKAEYASEAATTTCVACGRPIDSIYFEANGQIVCEPCRDSIRSAVAAGSAPARFLRASILGVVAGIAGFAIYYAVMKFAHMEIGLISILVGFMVGSAVRAGSRNKGGAVYQLLAVFLSYTAIGASYSAAIIPEMLKERQNRQNPQIAAAPQNPPANDFTKNLPDDPQKVAENDPKTDVKNDTKAEVKNDPKTVDAENTKTVVKNDPKANPDPEPTPAPKAPGPAELQNPKINAAADVQMSPIRALAVLAGLLMMSVYVLPILVGFQQPIGLLIIAFALWEAWKLNVRPRLEMRGPFRIDEARAAAAGEIPHHG
jgi:hypothetical protein